MDLRHWEEPGDPGLSILVGALFDEAPGAMRHIKLDAAWVIRQRLDQAAPRRSAANPSKVVLTLHTELGSDKDEVLDAVRAQIAARLNIPSDTVRILEERKGSIKITFEFDDSNDASRLLAQVQAGNEKILSLFQRWSAKPEEFIAENKEIHFHGPAEFHGPAAIGETVTQTVTITSQDATDALARLEALLAEHVRDPKDVADGRKHLGGAQAELDEEKPDHEKIARRTSRVIEVLKKTGERADWFNHVVECGKTIAEFCGHHAPLILHALGALVH